MNCENKGYQPDSHNNLRFFCAPKHGVKSVHIFFDAEIRRQGHIPRETVGCAWLVAYLDDGSLRFPFLGVVMLRCKACLQYRYHINAEGVCERCEPKRRENKVHFVAEDVDSLRTALFGANAHIVYRNQWIALRRRLDAYYNNVSDEDIHEYNAQVTKARQAKKGRFTLSAGYIYLLSSSVGYFKIGRALDIKTRMKSHERDYPVKLKLVHSIAVKYMIQCESFLLRLYRDKKMQGEWFELDDEDVDWIKSLTGDELDKLAAKSADVFYEFED